VPSHRELAIAEGMFDQRRLASCEAMVADVAKPPDGRTLFLFISLGSCVIGALTRCFSMPPLSDALGAALLPGPLEEHYFAFAVAFSEDQSCARMIFELHDLEPKPDERP
jgi:hypothetical protein